MNRAIILLLGLAMLALPGLRARNHKSKFRWLQNLSGSQKIFGLLAFVLALLILLNPEFLALGFLGDTALFDMLVLALSLQMHTHVMRAGRTFVTALATGMRWARIPSPGMLYLATAAISLMASAQSVLQKALHRIFS